ncbi:uncharacterized protein LOC122003087 [Zingiber officinale]|uniref:uncharacterized protein LOC122003087 n=1 Tax=Zingiber officinale TaxID=94328 RepID=UPI001C4C52AA|nr:uncharacterized protein LOC122003087 [Zingiber officinale]XP_042414462.1 uncharacterized protein LOC122003087 [Zingiber officinale]
MSEQNQEIIQSPANLPLKRKRGRPRKLQAATSSQPYPASNSSHGVQVIPNQVDLAAFSGMRPQTLPFHTPSKIGVDPTAHSRSASFAHYSEVSPTQPNSSIISNQKTNGLLGQTVCGTLDGTFEAGYLLTVKVGDTGHVLKGIVFDPHRCVPISEENDIAPLIPMARPIGTFYSPTEKPSQALVSVPVRPAAASFDVAAPHQRKEPPSTKIPESSNYKPSVLDINETLPKIAELTPVAPQNAAVGETQAEDSLSLFITNKEKPQVTAVVHSEDQRGIAIEPHTVAESSANIDMSDISGLDQRQQHHFEELLQGSMPQPSEQSSDQGQFCSDPKLQDEIWNL